MVHDDAAGFLVPERLRALISADIARDLASPFADEAVFPGRIDIDDPTDAERRFPGWAGAVVTVLVENQGVCAWGVPVASTDGPVLVGGQIKTRQGPARDTVVYSPDIEAFVAARRWDAACLSQEPGVGAQTDELDEASVNQLRGRFSERPGSAGWPGHTVYRFESDTTRILLWNWKGQCDWWISDPDAERLHGVVAALKTYFALEALVSSDPVGDEVRARLR